MKAGALLVAAVVLTVPVAGNAMGGKVEASKNSCLVYSENCPEQADTIIEKLEKLRQEIAKGTAVYTPEEVERLGRKLEEYQWHFDVLVQGGGE